MKIPSLTVFFLLLYIPIFGQTKIDENVTVEIPGKVSKANTVNRDAALSTFYSKSDADYYIVLRLAVISDGKELHTLPADSSSLKGIYQEIIPDQIAAMEKKGLKLNDSKYISIKNSQGYRLTFNDQLTNKPKAETLLLGLDGVIYIFIYSGNKNFIEKNKNKFQNSIAINKAAKQINTTKIDSGEKFSFADLISYGTLPLGLILFFILKSRKKSKWGVNLKPVYCPSCNKKQPMFRKPANQRQILWGGYTCSKCNTEMDKYGAAITSKEDNNKE